MIYSKHFNSRMAQRSITKDMIELAFKYGITSGDKCILDKKSTLQIINELNKMKKSLMRMSQKGGVVVVSKMAH